MKYLTKAYLIQCITHLHVGSGDANYGVVDNLVQRDPVSKLPVIHASSLKGALRQHFAENFSSKTDALQHIFGVDASSSDSTFGIGHYKFFGGELLAYPVRSDNRPFFMASSSELISDIKQRANDLGLIELDIDPFEGDAPEEKNPSAIVSCKVEGLIAQNNLHVNEEVVKKYFEGKDMVHFHQNDFCKILKRLPVIARNKLENGESKNLWYEEVVPRESRFIFFVSIPEEDNFSAAFEGLENATVQIGANGSIGYGYCKIKNIPSC